MDIKAFKGLNNVTDPLRAGVEFLARADNVNITETGAIAKRSGYTRAATGNFSAAYSTLDFRRLYLVDAGTLRDAEGATIATGLGNQQMYWTEVNGEVFYNDGSASGIIAADNTRTDWRWTVPAAPILAKTTGNLDPGTYRVRFTSVMDDGRETGAGETSEISIAQGEAFSISTIPPNTGVYIAHANSTVFRLASYPKATALVWNYSEDTLGAELVGSFLDPLPKDATVIQHWKGRIYAAQYMPSEDQTVIWFTEPLAYHLFNLNSNFLLVPGKVAMLAPHQDALVIGTTTRIYAYDSTSLVQLAEYGVVEGQHWATDPATKDHPDRLIFWTARGVCTAMPFTNLTERQVSVAPGLQAAGALVLDGGQKRYLVAIQQGGAAFNNF